MVIGLIRIPIPGSTLKFTMPPTMSLMISVVAEGVETQEQAQSLRELECEELQGFLFSPPVSAQEFARFLVREAAVPRSTSFHPQTVRWWRARSRCDLA